MLVDGCLNLIDYVDLVVKMGVNPKRIISIIEPIHLMNVNNSYFFYIKEQ